MADTVAYLLEQTVEECEEWERSGTFTRAEIKRIVAARTRHEYALKRRAVLKADFLRAIQYEEQLETLRRHRKKVQSAAAAAAAEAAAAAAAEGRPAAAPPPKPSGGAVDHAVLRRIHFLYTRALRKFKGDLRLWARLFAFCRAHGGSRALSRALTSALALHPTQPGLWSYAAAWELRQRRDAAAARALLQRGLRACPDSGPLLADYFGMELAAAEQLRARAEALGTLEEACSAEGEGAGRAALLRGAVAAAVFDSAAAARPDDVELRRRCLALLTARPWAEPLRARVLASLAEGPLALHPDALALRAAAAADWRGGAALFAAAAEAGGDARALAAAQAAHLSAAAPAREAAPALAALARRALAAGHASEDVLAAAVAALRASGEAEAAARLAADGAAALPASPRLWAARLELAAEAGAGAEAVAMAAKAVRCVPPGEAAERLWRAGLQLAAALGTDPGPMHAALRAGHAGGAGPRLGAAAAAVARQAALGVAGAGEVVGLLAALPGAAPAFHAARLRAAAAEAAAAVEAGEGAAEALARARAVAEAAVRAHGAAEPQLWAEYVGMEAAVGGGAKAAAPLLWRARKALRDADALSWLHL